MHVQMTSYYAITHTTIIDEPDSVMQQAQPLVICGHASTGYTTCIIMAGTYVEAGTMGGSF